jgi:hypothetical protein
MPLLLPQSAVLEAKRAE